MTTMVDGDSVRLVTLGARVERPTATLPQTTAGALFNVEGGRVLVTSIVGEVTTAIQNQANNTKLVANPDAGTSQDICAVLNIANDEVGTLYSISGVFADAMYGAVAGAAQGQARPFIVNPGTIDLDCAASNTGSVKWTITYIPIDDGAFVEAA